MIFQTIGAITPPDASILGQENLISFINKIITLLYVVSGLFVLINFILAGYGYLGANGDPQKIANAGNKILFSIIGLIFVAGSFVIAGVLGQVLFNNPQALIKPTFWGIN